MMENKWEAVSDSTRRLRVENGWIYEVYSLNRETNMVVSNSICFVPEPKKDEI